MIKASCEVSRQKPGGSRHRYGLSCSPKDGAAHTAVATGPSEEVCFPFHCSFLQRM